MHQASWRRQCHSELHPRQPLYVLNNRPISSDSLVSPGIRHPKKIIAAKEDDHVTITDTLREVWHHVGILRNIIDCVAGISQESQNHGVSIPSRGRSSAAYMRVITISSQPRRACAYSSPWYFMRVKRYGLKTHHNRSAQFACTLRTRRIPVG